MIALKLMSLRDIYTSSRMWAYRVRLDRMRFMERLVVGEQSDLIRKAIASAEEQRPVMVAIYGDKCPSEWKDPSGRLKDGIKLDFGPIEEAIKYFCPSWMPER